MVYIEQLPEAVPQWTPPADRRMSSGRRSQLSFHPLLHHTEQGFLQPLIHRGAWVKAHLDELVHFGVDFFHLGFVLVENALRLRD